MRQLKIKVVGDANVGKTSFLSHWYSESYSHYDGHSILPKSIPPVQDSYFTNLTFERVSYIVTYWDTCTLKSTDDFDILKLRPLEYRETDVFLVCFDISNPSSFQNISTVWVPELRHYMPGTPMVVVGNKKDLRSGNRDVTSCHVSQSKGQELADRLGTVYCENSALTGEGIREVIQTAVSLAVHSRMNSAESAKKKFKIFQRQKTPLKLSSHQLVPPCLPFPGPAPSIDVEDSTFEDDMHRLLDRSICADVTFNFGNSFPSMKAHKVLLSLASQAFRDVLLSRDNSRSNTSQFIIDTSPISDVDDDVCGEEQSRTLSSSFRTFITAQPKPFSYFLEFLYTGQLSLSEEEDAVLISDIMSIAKQVCLPELEQICENNLKKESFLNKNMFALVRDRRNHLAKEMFLNKVCLSDLTFSVEGRRVFAHKAIVMGRSEVMAAMLGGGFTESSNKEVVVKDTAMHAFIGMLEYLYTDCLPEHRTIEDDKRLLILADRYCLSRLRTLCELRISKQLNSEVKKKLKLTRETCEQVIDALLLSQVHNAGQLHRCCVYIISTNYTDFEFSDELALLHPDDVKLVTDHRWPPLSYFEQLDEFKKKSGHN